VIKPTTFRNLSFSKDTRIKDRSNHTGTMVFLR
jgi:hypothetical protein